MSDSYCISPIQFSPIQLLKANLNGLGPKGNSKTGLEVSSSSDSGLFTIDFNSASSESPCGDDGGAWIFFVHAVSLKHHVLSLPVS